MKVKIKTKLNANNQVYEYEGMGIYRDQCLQFMENQTKVVFNFLEQSMVRDDPEKKLSYKFTENHETMNEIFLYENRISVQLPIFTEKFSYHDSCCSIVYLVDSKDKICYQIDWEELK